MTWCFSSWLLFPWAQVICFAHFRCHDAIFVTNAANGCEQELVDVMASHQAFGNVGIVFASLQIHAVHEHKHCDSKVYVAYGSSYFVSNGKILS